MNAAAAAAPHPPASRPGRPLRLLIVDDSAVARAVLSRMLAPHGEFELVATAADGREALAALAATPADIVLLDIDMPGTDGLAALPAIAATGARVLIVSSACDRAGGGGAAPFAPHACGILAKPGAGQPAASFSEALVERLREIGGLGPAAAAPAAQAAAAQAAAARPAARTGGPAGGAGRQVACIGVGASTGGLHAVAALLAALPESVAAPVLVTQHLPPVFIPFFARQIEAACGRPVQVAEDGMALAPRRILVSPGDAHLRLDPRAGKVTARLDMRPAAGGSMPSVDAMLSAMAAAYGPGATAVILSGMGRDGLAGARDIVAAGGEVLVQDKDSCAVWGMPGAIAEAGLAAAVLPPAAIARRIADAAEALQGPAWT